MSRGPVRCHDDGMSTASRLPRGLVPLLVVSGCVLLVSWGLAEGVWLSNLHNGLLALSCTLVGAYVLLQRRGHPEGVLLLAAGAVAARARRPNRLLAQAALVPQKGPRPAATMCLLGCAGADGPPVHG